MIQRNVPVACCSESLHLKFFQIAVLKCDCCCLAEVNTVLEILVSVKAEPPVKPQQERKLMKGKVLLSLHLHPLLQFPGMQLGLGTRIEM